MRSLFASVLMLAAVASARGMTTIVPGANYGYGANLGWIDWRGDVTSGAVIGEYVCSGYLYSANVGWISLGSGKPANGIQYQNNSAADFGVNQVGGGNLRGYAWGANIGWICFEDQGAPKVNLQTGQLSGSIYSANCGWLSLSNALASVRTAVLVAAADSDGNGLPDAWELKFFGNLRVDPEADPDGDGASNRREYLAGTNPTNRNDRLVITAFQRTLNGLSANITWRSVDSRYYFLQKKPNVDALVWLDSGLGLIAPDAGATTLRTVAETAASSQIYRVQAVQPLVPSDTVYLPASAAALTFPFTLVGDYIYQATQTPVGSGGRAVYSFTLPTAGTYVVQAAVNAPNDSANSFFLNIDAEPQEPAMTWDLFPCTLGFEQRVVSWRGAGTDTGNQFTPKVFNLAAGAHQLILRGREANVLLRSLLIAPYPAVYLAATSGVLTAPMVLSNNWIYQPIQTTALTQAGRALYSFTLARGGTYILQATVNAPNDSANSFFVNIDAEPQAPEMIWDIAPWTAGWEARVVSWRGNGTDTHSQFAPKVFTLAPGPHQLIIRGREAYAQLQDLALLPYP